MSPFDWLVQCVRSYLGLGFTVPAGLVASPDLDWPAILTLIDEHQAHGYVLEGLKAASVFQAIPDHAQAELRTGATGLAHNSLRLARALHEVHRVLDEAGIELIALKGPVLALRTTGGLTARPFADIDVLVRAERVRSAAAALLDAGYRADRAHDLPISRRVMRADSEVGMFDPQGTYVELHWKNLPRFWQWRVEEQDIWEQSTSIDFFGAPLLRLGDTHELLSIALHHGGKHQWDAMNRIIDFHQLATLPAMDWADVWRTAYQTGTLRVLETGFRVCQRILGDDVEYKGMAGAPGNMEACTLAMILADWLRNGRSSDGTVRTAQYLRLRERWRDRLMYAPRLARELFTPTDKEQAILGERWTKVIGVPFRLLRLAVKYGTRWSRRRTTGGRVNGR